MSSTILVVDDEADLEVLVKQKFRKEIRQGKYDFHFATNGLHALQKIEEQPEIEIVLTDINMPEMDGLTLLSELNENSPLIKTVIISAYGDLDNIRMAMNRGAFDFLTKPINFKDLFITVEKTAKQALQIKETLEAIKQNNILKMYVDDNVLQFMGGKTYENELLSNETIEATVLFVDICGFTAISESASPDTVVSMINSYFEVMVKEIIDQNGFVDKFIGDAIMAVFKGEYHLDRAIDTALGIRQQIDNLPAVDGLNQFKPKVSIGLKSGEMISGNIGSSSLRRLDFTVIGDTVNTAARLQGAAKPGQIVICEDCYMKVKESFQCEKVGSITLKNKAQPIVVYEVIE